MVTSHPNSWFSDNLKQILKECNAAWRNYYKKKTEHNLQYYKERRKFALVATRAEKKLTFLLLILRKILNNLEHYEEI